MRPALALLALAGLLLIPVSPAPAARAADEQTVRMFIDLPTRLVPGDRAAVAGLGGSVRQVFATSNTISVELPASALPALRQVSRFANLTPVPQVFALEDALDWGVDRVNAEIVWGGAEGATDVQVGAIAGQGVKVAVIDTGIDRNHPDLAASLTGGRNWVDSCFWIWCWLTTDAFDDDNGHGTHVAGTIAAADNGAGLVGVAPRASIYAYKVLNAQGSGWLDDIIAAIEYASGLNGGIRADIISMSLGCYCNLPAFKAAVDHAYANNVLVVAAAGNCGTGGSSGCPASGSSDTVIHPAKYDSVIAVAATCGGSNFYCSGLDARASFSSVGPAVEVAAPGALVRSTYPDDAYATLSGTSMATPHVAGVAALVKAADPARSASHIRAVLQATAQDVGPTGRDASFGYGIVDAVAAVGAGPGGPDTAAPGIVAVTPSAGATKVPLDTLVTATFNEAMNGSTLNNTTFRLTGPADVAVAGSVAYDALAGRATFTPAAALEPGTTYTARVTTGAKDLAGNALPADRVWSFTTLTPCLAPTIIEHSDTLPDGGGIVSFSWEPVAGATRYTVQRQGAFGIWWTIDNVTETAYTAADASGDPSWRVRVAAGSCIPLPGPFTTFDP